MSFIPQNAIERLRAVQTIIMAPGHGRGFNMGVFYDHLVQDDDGVSVLQDMSPAQNTCGTVMCICGWMAELAPVRTAHGAFSVFNGLGMSTKNEELWDAFQRLFYASDRTGDLYVSLNDLTAVQAFQAIDQFIETDGAYAWRGIA